jgi:hypothetical protein
MHGEVLVGEGPISNWRGYKMSAQPQARPPGLFVDWVKPRDAQYYERHEQKNDDGSCNFQQYFQLRLPSGFAALSCSRSMTGSSSDRIQVPFTRNPLYVADAAVLQKQCFFLSPLLGPGRVEILSGIGFIAGSKHRYINHLRVSGRGIFLFC